MTHRLSTHLFKRSRINIVDSVSHLCCQSGPWLPNIYRHSPDGVNEGEQVACVLFVKTTCRSTIRVCKGVENEMVKYQTLKRLMHNIYGEKTGRETVGHIVAVASLCVGSGQCYCDLVLRLLGERPLTLVIRVSSTP